MRLIDADALIRTFCKQACQCTRSECKYTLEHDGRDACYDVLFVDAAPTITPEAVKGEWERYSLTALGTNNEWYRLRCSQCGLMPIGDIRNWNFCPNCGADMRSLRNRINGEIAGGDEE